MQAISAFPGCVAIIATCLRTDLKQLRSGLNQSASHAIAVIEHDDCVKRLYPTFLGIVTRGINPAALLECVRQVARGRSWIDADTANAASSREDLVGMRVRDRLTKREMRVAALLLQGRKNRDISSRLGTSEQAIKNCMRDIYNKTGVSDRLELALFIHHHTELLRAVDGVASEIKIEERSATFSSAVA
jgi:DNA-binding NarL/FixJ family response regulator